MPRFRYIAKESPEKRVSGFAEAESASAAVRKILGMGYVPVEVVGDQDAASGRVRNLRFFRNVRPKVSAQEAMLFTRQMSDLMLSGISVHRCLQIISPQTQHSFFRDVQENICDAIKHGGTLSEALSQFPDIFPSFYISMVRSGEIGGNLALILRRLADLQERDHEARRRIQSSLVYPGIIFMVGIVVVFVLFAFVIPRLTVLFDDFDAPLPVVTRILIGIGAFCSKAWWSVPAIAGLLVYIINSKRLLNARERMKNRILNNPLLGDFFMDVESERFLRTLGTLLENGVMIVPALKGATGVFGSGALKKKMDNVTKAVVKGESFGNALQQEGCFSPAVLSMIAVGEESGRLAGNLCKIADSYASRLSHRTKTMLSLLEPVCIIVIAGIVAFIVMAMLLPVFRLNLIVG